MLRLRTYKVVNDANDAVNVFAEMLLIKFTLQSLKEKRKKRFTVNPLLSPRGRGSLFLIWGET